MAFDIVSEVGWLRNFERLFILHPELMGGVGNLGLNWSRLKFTAANQAAVPAQRGLYAFTVVADNPCLPPNAYVMYIGETGDKNKRHLQVRYGDYLDEQKTLKRASVHFMLNAWEDHIYFYYSPVTDRRRRLKKIEQTLNDALQPPISRRDFTAKIRTIRRAF
jgi:hypothetical protein